MGDEVFAVYVRDAHGATRFTNLREGLGEFLDPEKGYRISINIEGVVITLRNEWDMKLIEELDYHLDQKSIECVATVEGL